MTKLPPTTPTPTPDPSADFSATMKADRLADVGIHRDALTKMRELQSDRLKLRLAQERRALVSADDVNRVLTELGLDLVGQLQSVEQNMTSFLDSPGRKHLREQLNRTIAHMRERLTSCVIRSAIELPDGELPAFEAESLRNMTISKKTPKTARRIGRPKKK